MSAYPHNEHANETPVAEEKKQKHPYRALGRAFVSGLVTVVLTLLLLIFSWKLALAEFAVGLLVTGLLLIPFVRYALSVEATIASFVLGFFRDFFGGSGNNSGKNSNSHR